MKRILSLIVAVMMLGTVFSGCSNESATPDANEKATTAQTETTATNGKTPAEGGARQISGEFEMAIFQGGYGADYWNEMIKLFESKYPGIKIKAEINPKIGDMIRPRIISGDAPDFIYNNVQQKDGVISGLIKDKALLELTELFNEKALGKDVVLKDIIFPGMLESPVFSPYGDSKVYLAPFNTAPSGLIYNKTLFAEKGWKVPETWDEFFALGDIAKKEGRSLYTFAGIYPGYSNSMMLPALANHIGLDNLYKFFNYEEGSFSSPEVKEVLNNIEKIAKGGYLMPSSVGLNHTQSQAEMMMGKSLFISNGTWIENEMKDAPREGEEKFEFAILPGLKMSKDEKTTHIVTSSEMFSIPKSAKNPEAAKEFIKFVYTDESIKLFGKKAGGMIAVKDAVEMIKDDITPSMYNMLSVYSTPDAKVFVQGYKAAPVNSKFNPATEIYEKGIIPLYNSDITVDEWCKRVEKSFAGVRAEYKATAK